MEGLCCEEVLLREIEPVRSMLLREGATPALFRPGRSSTLFLLGDPFLASRELSRRFSCVSTRGRRSIFWTWSIADEFGSDDEVPSPLLVREPELSEVGICCGLPPLPLRLFCGIVTETALMGVVSPRLGKPTDELVLRRDNDGGWEVIGLPRMLPLLKARAVALELRCPVMDSRIALISTGIGTRWTRLTVGQSAACINLCSAGFGGLQQPGHPGLCMPLNFGLVLFRAHWDHEG